MSSGAPPQAAKLVPQEPDKTMTIRRLHPSILICSTPFYRVGRIKIGGRGTIVKLADSSLAVFSPVALTDIVKSRIQEELGSTDVKYITALDQEHHIFLESWHKEWPEAKIIAPETLPALRDKQKYFKLPQENWRLMKKEDRGESGSGFSVDEVFDGEFDVEYVDAHPNKELVFNHKPSGTLIEADLIFNLPATEQFSRTNEDATSGWATKVLSSVYGTQGSALAQKRFVWYAISIGNRQGFAESVSRIAKWNFDRIVPCHGDVIESGGKGIFERIMEWHLKLAEEKRSSR